MRSEATIMSLAVVEEWSLCVTLVANGFTHIPLAAP